MRVAPVRFRPRIPVTLVPVLVCSLALLVAGCGGDDNPANPGPPSGSTDDFDQATAIAQSELAGSEAVALVQNMVTLAGGLTKAADKDFDYGWNEETQRWEWSYNIDEEGYVYDYFYTVQYLDGDGEPQQEALGAASIDHRMRGDASYHYESDGTVSDQEWSYAYNSLLTGLGGSVLTMIADGGWDWDISGSSGGTSYAYVYAIEWQTLGGGISWPIPDGCPTGTIRYDFPPFYSLVVFDGTDEAVSTLYDADGTPVPDGSDVHPLFCGL